MIRFENISKVYQSKNSIIEAVSNVTIHVKEREIYGIIGFSGAGKSTLLRIGNLLEKPSVGKIYMNQQPLTTLSKKELREARHKIGMIFQSFNLVSNKTVWDNVRFLCPLPQSLF
ncbi:methionine ABC transporter ATP-binding protein [Alkalihalobacillus alcalophilus ATCC 27647 = CGMCC 1.3604]|uniref:D-methionine transporter n=1 Tax=Alkalihalobacillus alcalophilus ATCC 27647 = CGMCC 1.3604 TaxID=1218173 RepID=J8T5Z4_ALKAL|nr:ATP-binding cassette domain-containing protein [Alkalihalobacillus alcalophilus]AFV25969.1 D-methionine transporter [Alkalihalobacillus alcalophilus ATCC 27647 = CGMCC 1.3604]KGA96099.1 hypothetical protein BALCAV_0218275 [Alkalihalobacillus alcalophilus ATCC 27647 = CGMCC 1.3604]MED1562847.1 ATP-binding cassette domain-containing protein [Alkalihalobacillus alcalophilus]THG88832.1 methionine ABC transporter ATP-binding protein [Alkalihalobacillus alcalophilus ATCC 27647 = CGMCC 1.3604]